jgi:hypothetical protein
MDILLVLALQKPKTPPAHAKEAKKPPALGSLMASWTKLRRSSRQLLPGLDKYVISRYDLRGFGDSLVAYATQG